MTCVVTESTDVIHTYQRQYYSTGPNVKQFVTHEIAATQPAARK